MSAQRVLILLWKYFLVKEEELFYWWKVSKFLLAPLFANARRVKVSKFQVENTAILRLRPRKLIFLLFSKIKGFLREQLTSDYLSNQKLVMDKKWRKSIFQLLPLDGRYFLTVTLKLRNVKPFFSYLPVNIAKIKPRKILSCQNLAIGPLRFPFTWYKTAMMGRKSRTRVRPTKGMHNFKL